MIALKKRRLIRDWTPIIPILPTKGDFAFDPKFRPEWNAARRDWLRRYYPDAEDWQLAFKINCTEQEIVRQAKRMELKKSHEFRLWETRDPNKREKGCPAGFHFETEEELQARLQMELERDQRRAGNMAKHYDFATQEEKESIAAALVTAIQWGRATQPDYNYDFDYWN